ncbi:MAG: beta-ketoacyl-ACP synthase II [Candidatus Cloacimonetes bacterium]|nr:beta-ketoacyl-ACP synthase II [Candidatus Cloacimonadota bacterium]
MKRRVVITGMGTINPVGNNIDETWQNLLAGKRGARTIDRFDITDFPVKFAAQVNGYESANHFDPKEVKKIDLYAQYAVVAARQAMKDSGLEDHPYDHNRIGCIVGAGIGGIITFEEEVIKMVEKGPRRISPFFIPKMISNIAAAHISIEYNLKGINFNVVSACASSNHAIGTAFRSIQYGDADVIVAAGCEAAVSPMAVGGFSALKALSTRNDDPASASRPFDKDRDGFVISEGAAALILEELEHAKARGAQIYAEVLGYGATADAYHITAPTENGEGSARAMQMALDDAGLKATDIDYINAHGTSTPLNDVTETISIKTVFGPHAYKVKINSTKSMVGHMLGAAAAMEAIVCVKSICDQKLHLTANLENPSPECDLDYVQGKSIDHKVTYALSNSLGFGGQNSAIVIGKY